MIAQRKCPSRYDGHRGGEYHHKDYRNLHLKISIWFDLAIVGTCKALLSKTKNAPEEETYASNSVCLATETTLCQINLHTNQYHRVEARNQIIDGRS